MNNLLILIRREFWEHRSLWLAPVVATGVLLLLISIGVVRLGGVLEHVMGPDFQNLEHVEQLKPADQERISQAIDMPQEKRQMVYAGFLVMMSASLSIVACIVVFFYLIDSLYTERRDRSILFWKSLPLSDGEVVTSKALVGMVIVPFGLIALAALMHVFAGLIWHVRFSGTWLGSIMPGFDIGAWLRVQWALLQITLAGVLWYVPIAGYLLLVSAWARGKVFLWAVLPWAGLMLAEQFIHTGAVVAKFLGHRFTGFVELMKTPGSEGLSRVIPGLDAVMAQFGVGGVLASPETWIGVAVGAALIFAAVRVRRYRDDT